MSSHTIVSGEIKLLRMLGTVLLKITTFSLALVFKKTLCQLKFSIALYISSVFASFSAKPLVKKPEENEFVS